ncbi:MAG: hypothetical protein WBM46_15600, partial [Polyangiales bacterium]
HRPSPNGSTRAVPRIATTARFAGLRARCGPVSWVAAWVSGNWLEVTDSDGATTISAPRTLFIWTLC